MKPKLLIVDDEPDMLDFLERVFRADFEVVRAMNAEDALAALAGTPFDVLVTDQKMPRVSGVELLERISPLYPDLVRILLSGFTDLPEIQSAAQRCRIDGYVVKPVDSDKLKCAVSEAVSANRGRS